MGGSESKRKSCIVGIIDEFVEVSKGTLSEKEFTQQMFQRLDNNPQHSDAGIIMVSDTHVLKAFYGYIAQKHGNVNKARVKEYIQKIYDKPDKAIQYTYRVISGGSDSGLSRKNFLQYVNKCFQRGVYSFEGKSEPLFRKSFREWIETNRMALFGSIEALFTQHAQSDRDTWTMGDLKRWVMSQDHWFLVVGVKGDKHKIPLHLPAVFGINFQVDSD